MSRKLIYKSLNSSARMLLVTLLFMIPTHGRAGTDCQNAQADAAAALIYAPLDSSGFYGGILGADIDKRLGKVPVADLKGLFISSYNKARQSSGCELKFTGESMFPIWESLAQALVLKQCPENACKRQAIKRIRIIENYIGRQASASLVGQCGNASSKKVKNFDKLINRFSKLLGNVGGDANEARDAAGKLSNVVDKICSDILFKSPGVKVSVGEAPLPTDIINLEQVLDGVDMLASISTESDQANLLLQNVTSILPLWQGVPGAGMNVDQAQLQKGAKLVVPKDLVLAAGGDNERREARLEFLQGDSVVYAETVPVTVDVVPPQAPVEVWDFPARIAVANNGSLITYNQAGQKMGENLAALDFRVKLRDGFRAGEADRLVILWNGVPVFPAPLNLGNAGSGATLPVQIPAAFIQNAGNGDFVMEAKLLDEARNSSASINQSVRVESAIPVPSSVSVSKQFCKGRNVINALGGELTVGIPGSQIRTEDRLNIKYGDREVHDQALPSPSTDPLVVSVDMAQASLGDINSNVESQSILAVAIRRGQALGDALYAPVYVDTVTPNQPTIILSDQPLVAGQPYQFKVVVAESGEVPTINWKGRTVTPSDIVQQGLTYNVTLTAEETAFQPDDPSGIEAFSTDWACNTSPPARAVPSKQANAPVLLSVETASCSGRAVVNEAVMSNGVDVKLAVTDQVKPGSSVRLFWGNQTFDGVLGAGGLITLPPSVVIAAGEGTLTASAAVFSQGVESPKSNSQQVSVDFTKPGRVSNIGILPPAPHPRGQISWNSNSGWVTSPYSVFAIQKSGYPYASSERFVVTMQLDENLSAGDTLWVAWDSAIPKPYVNPYVPYTLTKAYVQGTDLGVRIDLQFTMNTYDSLPTVCRGFVAPNRTCEEFREASSPCGEGNCYIYWWGSPIYVDVRVQDSACNVGDMRGITTYVKRSGFYHYQPGGNDNNLN